MYRIETLGYVTLGVTDLEAAIDFYTRVVRLQVVDRRPGVAFLSGGPEHHWLRLHETPTAGVIRVGYKVKDEATLLGIRDVLTERGVAFTEGGDVGQDRVDRWLRFVDPAGTEVELYPTMPTQAVFVNPPGIGLNTMLHTLWSVPNFDETVKFYRDVFDFRVSDYIESSVAFMRCEDGYHHSLGFGRGAGTTNFSHFCILVDHIDDVMRYRYNAAALGVKIQLDLLRHPTSGSMGVYLTEPFSGFGVEFCTQHLRILPEEEATYRPRVVAMGPGALDVWKQPLPEVNPATTTRFEDVAPLLASGPQPFEGQTELMQRPAPAAVTAGTPADRALEEAGG